MVSAYESDRIEPEFFETTGRTAEEFVLSPETADFLKIRTTGVQPPGLATPDTSSGGDWRDRAFCKGKDTELFYAPRHAGSTDSRRIQAAKALCNVCPVRSECLEWALGPGSNDWWILGGLTPKERVALKSQRRRKLG